MLILGGLYDWHALATNSAFAIGSGKTAENVDGPRQSQDLPDTLDLEPAVGHLNTRPLLIQITLKRSIRAPKETQYFCIKNINWLTLFKEVTSVYNENHTRHIEQNTE
jgi:hypothetical protein